VDRLQARNREHRASECWLGLISPQASSKSGYKRQDALAILPTHRRRLSSLRLSGRRPEPELCPPWQVLARGTTGGAGLRQSCRHASRPRSRSCDTAGVRGVMCERKCRSNPLPGGERAVRPWGGLWSRERTHPGASRHPSPGGDFLGEIYFPGTHSQWLLVRSDRGCTANKEDPLPRKTRRLPCKRGTNVETRFCQRIEHAAGWVRLCGQNPRGTLSQLVMRCWTSATHPTAMTVAPALLACSPGRISTAFLFHERMR